MKWSLRSSTITHCLFHFYLALCCPRRIPCFFCFLSLLSLLALCPSPSPCPCPSPCPDFCPLRDRLFCCYHHPSYKHLHTESRRLTHWHTHTHNTHTPVVLFLSFLLVSRSLLPPSSLLPTMSSTSKCWSRRSSLGGWTSVLTPVQYQMEEGTQVVHWR